LLGVMTVISGGVWLTFLFFSRLDHWRG